MIEHTPSPCRRPAALIACPDCGRDVSYRAHTCPNCGRPSPGGTRFCPVAAVVGIGIFIAMGCFVMARVEDRRAAASYRTSNSVLACGHQGGWDEAMSMRQSGTGYLGIQCYEESEGAVIDLIGRNSPAHRIGLESGDHIVRIGGAEIRCFHDVLGAIWKHKPGDEVSVAVRRGGETRVFDVTLQKHPRD